jgi:hypothetical protein
VKKESELFVCTVLNLITDLYQDIGTIHQDDLQNLLDWYSGVDKTDLKCRESLLVSVVPVQAILIKHSIDTGSDNNRYFHVVRYIQFVMFTMDRHFNCFDLLSQYKETLNSLLSTGWFQEWIRKCVYKLIVSYTIKLK